MTPTTARRDSFALALTFALVTASAAGCDVGTKPVGTDEAGEDETADEGSVDAGQTTTTGGEEGTGEGSGDTTDTETTETTDTTRGSNEETGEEADWEAICVASCEVATTCLEENMGDLTCVEDCIDELEYLSVEYPFCAPLMADAYACFGGLNCAQAMTNAGCTEEFAALGECGGIGCSTSLGGSPDMTTCEFEHECTFGPVYAIECEGDTCVCSVNGTPVNSCANDGSVCGSQPFFDMTPVNACCDWELSAD